MPLVTSDLLDAKINFKLIFVTILVGIVAGLAGMCLALLLHFIQHQAYGYSHSLAHPENFLQGVTAAAPLKRLALLALCGLIAGFGWFFLYRFGKPLSTIAAAVKADEPKMPFGSATINALLQIITVGLGSPLGREVAPREIAAAFACWISAKSGLSWKHSQIMIACAAGGGLAAVYNVPLGGTVFILETLLFTFSWSALIPALCICSIATAISWIGLGNEPQYQLPDFSLNLSLIIWSIVVGPLFGVAAFFFNQIINSARAKAPKNGQLIFLCLINFMAIGILAVYLPALLGNGKGPIQLGFTNTLDVSLAAKLLVLRVLIVWSSLRAGAQGGLLTPSLANGVLMATILGSFWSVFWPGTPTGAYSVIGAAAFLAAALKMPLTAIVLTAEFTNIDFNFLVPILFAVMGSVATFNFCEAKKSLGAKPIISIPLSERRDSV
ncbi:MAG: chloride channel protein [Tatlockia sp.]|nr:chloride channel protein [Tatlockia sp.]